MSYHPERRLDASGRVLLDPEGEELGAGDAGRGLFLIDCAWRRVPLLLRAVDGEPLRRRLPKLSTAYPRRSTTFEDPRSGLASIEALYAAVCLLDGPRPELIEHYHWREKFLALNPGLPRA